MTQVLCRIPLMAVPHQLLLNQSLFISSFWSCTHRLPCRMNHF
jgi:hypothetical protein